MNKYWKGVFGQVRAMQKRFVRDKVALFFTFLFPLIFLFVFGSIFRNETVSFNAALIDHANTEFSKGFARQAKTSKDSPIKIDEELKTIDQAKEKMKRSEIDGIIELTKGFGEVDETGRPKGEAKVLYQKGSEQAGQTLTALMSQIIENINYSIGQPKPPLTVVSEGVGQKGLSSFDYVFSGLLAFSLMSMGIFGLANQMPAEKQKGSYRRLRAAPFSSGQLIIAMAIHYLLITLLSVTAMLAVGVGLFDFNMRGDIPTFAVFAVVSAFMTIGIGLMIGAWAKNENQSAPISNLVSFPLMFLSGSFFPRFAFPEWLQGIAAYIPLSPVVDGFRLILTEGASFMQLGVQFAVIGVWLVIVYAVAIKLFRWE